MVWELLSRPWEWKALINLLRVSSWALGHFHSPSSREMSLWVGPRELAACGTGAH